MAAALAEVARVILACLLSFISSSSQHVDTEASNLRLAGPAYLRPEQVPKICRLKVLLLSTLFRSDGFDARMKAWVSRSREQPCQPLESWLRSHWTACKLTPPLFGMPISFRDVIVSFFDGTDKRRTTCANNHRSRRLHIQLRGGLVDIMVRLAPITLIPRSHVQS